MISQYTHDANTAELVELTDEPTPGVVCFVRYTTREDRQLCETYVAEGLDAEKEMYEAGCCPCHLCTPRKTSIDPEVGPIESIRRLAKGPHLWLP